MAKHDLIDKFGVEEMSKEEYQKKQDYVTKNCKCPGCPTYMEGDAPVGYCLPRIGTSKKISTEKECVCETCPIYKEYELENTFYCTRCSEVCQDLKGQVLMGP